MLSLHGNMRLFLALFILTFIEAKRRRPSNLENEQENLNRRPKTTDVDVYPNSFGAAVDFGHVYKNGYRGQNIEVEPDMIEPRNLEHAKQLLRKAGSEMAWAKKAEEPRGFSNPRDAIQYYNLSRKTNNSDVGQTLTQPSIRKATQNRRKKIEDEIKIDHHRLPEARLNDENDKDKFFSKSGFELVSDESYHRGNWTTCKEFAKGAVFHPDDVINLEWVPFYIWSLRRFTTSTIHKLTYPTIKLVKEYKEKFDPYLNLKTDWEQPKLLLKESKDMLLIAGDRKGLFYGIPDVQLPSSAKHLNIKIPVIIIRMKIVDPYLALMYCDEHYAVIMAIAGSEPPTDDDKTAESAILKFQGKGSPAARDLGAEARQVKFERDMKRREEENKYITIRKPVNTIDASLW